MHVLLVEDHAEVRTALAQLLEREGFEVTAAASAIEALAAASARPIGLLVTDQHLPGGLGTELIETLRGRGHPVPALIITAGDDPPALEGVQTLRKPMDLAVFVQEVHRLAERAGPGPPPRPLVAMRLYVSARSPASLRAQLRLKRLLARCEPSAYALELIDFDRGLPPSAEADRVLSLPALLVETGDGRRVRILGDLQSTEGLEAVLGSAGVVLRPAQ